jgi:hypothetical protein
LQKNEALDKDEIDSLLLEMSRKIDPEGTKEGKPVPLVEKIITHIVTKGRTTRQELKDGFQLAEKNELLPLVFFMQGEGLIKPGKGYYATTKLIQLWRERFACFACFTRVKKERGQKSEGREVEGGSNFDASKTGKAGKIDSFTEGAEV